jgi:hypothetical protein
MRELLQADQRLQRKIKVIEKVLATLTLGAVRTA